jgi:EAL and modified HD-GYP domain-containing signal transduction protein
VVEERPEYFIARQPIFDRDLKLCAYELLFRDAYTDEAPSDIDVVAATAHILSTTDEVGLDAVVGAHKAFIKISGRFLEEPGLMPLAPGRVVLELPEDIEFTPERIEGARQLSERGFTLALDNYVHDERYDPVMPFVRIAKFAAQSIPRAQWKTEIDALKAHGKRVVAQKIEGPHEYEILDDLGCDFFQGYFFAKPKIVQGKRLASNQVALVQLLAKINDPSADIDQLSELVSHDVALSVRVLNHVNSAAWSLNHHVDSIREAVVYLGRDEVRNLAALMLMSQVDRKPKEIMVMALVRAKFCELLARECREPNPDTFFTAGLFSVLDALMDTPMDELLVELKVSDEMAGALLHHEGEIGEALEIAKQIEVGADLPQPEEDEVQLHELADLHNRATAWADSVAVSTGLA